MGIQRTKILIVQDDPEGRATKEHFNRKEKPLYDCVYVNSVAAGRKAVESVNYDAVVTDCILHDGDARDLIIACQQDVPVVVVAESGNEELAATAMASGAAGYVIKDPARRYFKTLPVTISHAIKFKRVERELRSYENNLIKIVETRSHQLNEKNNQLYLEIQERMRAKEELMHTTEQLSVLLESLPIIPYACNAEDGSSITYVSNAIEEITGFGPDEFIQDSRFWTKHIHPADRKQVMAKLAVKSENHKHHFEYRFRIADGTFKWFSDTRRYVKLPDGTVSHIVGTWQDISAEKKLRLESEHRQQQLIQADKLASLGEVVAGVAHEINNPNSFITYNVPLLKETWEIFEPIITEYAAAHPDWRKGDIGISELCEDMSEIIQAIRTGSERINVVVTNLKDFARLDESVYAKPVQVNQVVDKTLSIVGAQLSKSIIRVGETVSTPVNVRIVSATNRELEAACQEGNFRLDLFYRIKSAHIHLPPLNERMDDIPLLASHFLTRASARHEKTVQGFSPEALDVLTANIYSGNIRELAQIVENAVLLTDAPMILPLHLGEAHSRAPSLARRLCSFKENYDTHLVYVFVHSKGDTTQTARILDVSVRQVQRKLADLRGNPRWKALLENL